MVRVSFMFAPPPVSDILILAPTEKELSVFEVNFINEGEIKEVRSHYVFNSFMSIKIRSTFFAGDPFDP